MIAAAVFDLDDTLFLQAGWLHGAWIAVAEYARSVGADGDRLHAALLEVAAEGTAAGGVIDRAVEIADQEDLSVDDLVAVFRSHRPARLDPLPGVVEGLAELRGHCLLGLVSDGDVAIQNNKFEALGLVEAFDAVVWSDSLGRERRKPHRAPFEAVLDRLGVESADSVYVGDNPDKDVVGASAVGMRAIRVRTGEYADRSGPEPWADVADAAAAMRVIMTELVAAPAG